MPGPAEDVLAGIVAVIKDHPEVLALWREAMKQKGNQHTEKSNPDNVREAACGNSKAYTVSRLKRESPGNRGGNGEGAADPKACRFCGGKFTTANRQNPRRRSRRDRL
jgi:hypothetical protein